MKNISYKILGILTVIAIVIACAVNPVTGKKEISFMSEAQEAQLGAQADPSIIAQFGLYDDPELQAFITEKGDEMAKISHRPNLDFSFKVVNSPVVNAFAVPGGYVYFTRGIMAHFNNEAEFAGVLGHEIGHVTARHGAQQQTQQTLGQIALVGGMVASKEIREFADVAQQSLGMLFLKFSRDDETQSDTLGVAYSTAVGYDAHYMADFFQTLNRLSGGPENRLPEFSSTHPDPINRYENVHQHAEFYQARDPRTDYKVNRDGYLRMIDGLVYGEDPREGYTEGNSFYHPVLKFTFDKPNAWQLLNSPTMVQMGPEKGDALINFSLAQGASMEAAAGAFQEQYKSTTIASDRRTINGNQALIVESEIVQTDQQTGQSQTLSLHSTYITYGDYIYHFMGLTLKPQYAGYKNSFRNTALSFAPLTNPSKINVSPERIKIVTAGNRMTLKKALTANNIPAERHQELSILNGMELGDYLEKGTLYKVVSK